MLQRISTSSAALALVSLFAFQSFADTPITPASTLPESTPWDLSALSVAPKFHWLSQEGDVRPLLYSGTPYQGHDTEVFAYYASPATLGHAESDAKFPAMVLVHGGGGTAFPEWAKLWAARGYAAIAMDLAGKDATGAPLANGGPDQDDSTKFGKIDSPESDQWPYQAVANVILAHSLVRTFDDVDADRTAITGISWGGYLTNIVAGLDNRFKAAVPVYGCGFLNEGSAWDDQFAAMTDAQRDKWVKLWDPSSYVGSAQMPVFFVNGTNDFAYWLESYAKTCELARGEKNYRITVNMPHGHGVGWAPQEIGLFIDQYLIKGTPLPKIAAPELNDGAARAMFETATKLEAAELHYTVDTLPNPDRTWTSIPATITDNTLHASGLPADAKIWFFTATDERDAVVSSELVFANAPG